MAVTRLVPLLGCLLALASMANAQGLKFVGDSRVIVSRAAHDLMMAKLIIPIGRPCCLVCDCACKLHHLDALFGANSAEGAPGNIPSTLCCFVIYCYTSDSEYRLHLLNPQCSPFPRTPRTSLASRHFHVLQLLVFAIPILGHRLHAL